MADDRDAHVLVLPADFEELTGGQYVGRPQLRPVLDAVLAALPSLGPVTVAARKSCVSLVSPRRTFAAVQPTTKSRVDLGLRLDGMEPAGRPGHRLVARIRLADAKGNPVCARVNPPALTWSVEKCG